MQVVTHYSDAELPLVLEACERMQHHLTAAIVSNDIIFNQMVGTPPALGMLACLLACLGCVH